MTYRSLADALHDLPKDQLLRIPFETDPYLEMAEIHRRIHEADGPAIFFEKVKGSPFPALSNLYGTRERTAFLFRHQMEGVQKLIQLKGDPSLFLQKPFHFLSTAFTALHGLPRKAGFSKPILSGTTSLSQLPQIISWPKDGGAFIYLPQVMSLPPGDQKIMHSNIGMYRIQISGNDYVPDKEAGMHYQLHRGIGVHHTMYNETDTAFKVSIFVGGPPSHAFAAIMPLPEGLSEVTFAGLLAGRRFRYCWKDGYVLSADADFVITGIVRKDKKPEGPFGDHLGYYSLQHDFPVLEVTNVYHRKNPIWQFTVVGRPPQEDSNFGWLIHELAEPLAPKEFPGLKEVHAVDAAGVHPLLLAIGHERYMPFREPVPEEILTIANHLLGKGQTSLAKYLFIACHEDQPSLTTHDIPVFFQHILSRIDFHRDLHFQTKTTIDTLDYSGDGWNAGSKLIMAARGPVRRKLATEIPSQLHLPVNCKRVDAVMPGILAMSFSTFTNYDNAEIEISELIASLSGQDLSGWPLVILTEDSKWMAEHVNNYLWATFTRSQPAKDVYGLNARTSNKHWMCDPPLIIDARIKPHHAPVLETDPAVSKRVDILFAPGGPLHGKVKGL